MVQVDEPYLQARPEEARKYGVRAINRALHGITGTTAVHLCFGYAAIIHDRPEGYSFYALYPEAYLEAASALAGTPVHAIGIRSIGLGLAALIAAACDGAMPISVRPVGHPFQRELRLSPALQRRLLEGAPDTVYAIADEGPGLSGSSFSAA